MTASDERDQRPRNSFAVWLSAAALIFAVYVLSTGPAVWLVSHGYLSQSCFSDLRAA